MLRTAACVGQRITPTESIFVYDLGYERDFTDNYTHRSGIAFSLRVAPTHRLNSNQEPQLVALLDIDVAIEHVLSLAQVITSGTDSKQEEALYTHSERWLFANEEPVNTRRTRAYFPASQKWLRLKFNQYVHPDHVDFSQQEEVFAQRYSMSAILRAFVYMVVIYLNMFNIVFNRYLLCINICFLQVFACFWCVYHVFRGNVSRWKVRCVV